MSGAKDCKSAGICAVASERFHRKRDPKVPFPSSPYRTWPTICVESMHWRKLRQQKTDKTGGRCTAAHKKTVLKGTASLTGRIRSPHGGHDGMGPCDYTGMNRLKMYFDRNVL